MTESKVILFGALAGVVAHYVAWGGLSTVFDHGAALLFAGVGATSAWLTATYIRQSLEVGPIPAYSPPYVAIDDEKEDE